MKNITISEKLIFYFVFLGIVVIIIIGSYSYYFDKKALLDRTFDQLTSLRLEKKNRIEQFFSDRYRDINLISKSEEIEKIIEFLNYHKNAESYNKPEINSYLTKYISSNGYYQKMHVINRQNEKFEIECNQSDNYQIIYTNSKIDSNIVQFCRKINLLKNSIVEDITKSKPLIYIGTIIYDKSQHSVGYIILEIPISAINKIMFGYTENNGLGKTGETYLVGSDYLMRSNSRFKENAINNIEVKSLAAINALKGKTGFDIVHDYRNISVLSSYSSLNIEGLNWVILAEIDEQEAMIQIYYVRNSILLISLIIAAVVFIFAFIVSKRITLPIKRLQKASEEIGEGNYNIHLNVASKDEIGLLTEAFNNMTFRLKRQSIEIEEEKAKGVRLLIDGQEMERQRLSRDLHDSLGQSLLAVKIKLEQAKNANIEKSQQIIVETLELLKHTVYEIKNISNDLMPAILEAFGIEQALKNICKNSEINTGIQFEYISENIPEFLESKHQNYIYRICQEAINNISKHSQATKVSMTFIYKNNSFELNIHDNGKGFKHEFIDNKGYGLHNIKERVKLLKGNCNITSAINKGTNINIVIPYYYNGKNKNNIS